MSRRDLRRARVKGYLLGVGIGLFVTWWIWGPVLWRVVR